MTVKCPFFFANISKDFTLCHTFVTFDEKSFLKGFF